MLPLDPRKVLLKIHELMALWSAGRVTHESTLVNIQKALKEDPQAKAKRGFLRRFRKGKR
jgi:hypothetical protein